MISAMLDRFSQDPYGGWAKPAEERFTCDCGRRTLPRETMCQGCREEQAIRDMTFGEFWTYLRNNMDGTDIDVVYTPGMLEFRIDFDSELAARKVAGLLKMREVRHVHNGVCLTFWIGGNFDFI